MSWYFQSCKHTAVCWSSLVCRCWTKAKFQPKLWELLSFAISDRWFVFIINNRSYRIFRSRMRASDNLLVYGGRLGGAPHPLQLFECWYSLTWYCIHHWEEVGPASKDWLCKRMDLQDQYMNCMFFGPKLDQNVVLSGEECCIHSNVILVDWLLLDDTMMLFDD